ncbi:bifunctional DNA primase/polymerase [Bradyrhizobium sp. CCBAU 21362]|uniref:bifunctional DNA primase/polymerase n=1 Tax=Bradyrhizobium sp. CCBAU 21362 TaxID=1325082 RepID=UPI00230636C6|nr:bifunctional DNA primase/polymerase [Bradyrhizobium sp. CCBAU 21362]
MSERDGRAPPASKLDFALDARRRGFMPFPLEPGSAEPAFPQGDAMATPHEIVLRSWWNENADFNVGLSTENLLTLRITEQPEKLRPLAALLLEHDVPPAVVTKRVCPNAGAEVCLHFLLPVGATVEAQSDVLFPGIDVLSTDEFVVGPGSVLDGNRCEFAANNSLPEAPLWLLEVCGVVMPAESKSMNVVALKQPTPVAPASAPIKTKLDWALEAAQYIPVHPLRRYVDPGAGASQKERALAVRNAKAAILDDWPNLATQDPTQIRKWWKQYPDANIGGATRDFIVVDIDPRHGGDDTFAALEAVEHFPETATTRSQSGGRHLIYVAPDGPVKGDTKGDVLGVGIDVKARGGYVVMPGSTIEGRMYTRENARPPAFAPQWIVERLKTARPKTAAAGKRVVEEDDIAIELFKNYILKHAPHAEIGCIDDTTFAVCARGYDFGCTQETIYEMALGWNETHCDGLGDVDRLAVVVESAGRNRENPIGCSHPYAPGFYPVEIDESKAPKSAARIPTSDLIQTSAQFVQGFVPPEYLVDQVLQRRFCYSITAQTGVGKTAVAMLLSAHVGAGRSLGNLDVEQGSVLYFAGENPTDIQMRWLGITRELNIDPAAADVHFIPGAMPLSQAAARITEEVTRKGLRPALVVVDTAAAYFEGDDENSNTQAVAHARRLRALTELPGGPCVLILCHPTKRAADDDLIPRGGGAFLAEVDGNIALQKRESLIVASSLGKFRGRDFAPLSFELKTVQHPVLKDARGRSIPTVVARHLGEVEKQRISADTLSRENELLETVNARPDASLRELAELLGWRFKTGQPDQSKVSRALEALAKAKLVRKNGRRWEVTPSGLSELERSTRPTECPETGENRCSSAATDEADIRLKNEPSGRATKRVLQSATK